MRALSPSLRAVFATLLLGACAPPKPPTPPVVPEAPPLADAEPQLHADNHHIVPSDVPPKTEATPAPSDEQEDDVTADDEPDAKTDAEPTKAEPALASLTGEYRYSGGKSSARKSIDDVVDDMNVMVRNIARKKLIEANDVPNRVEIEQSGDEVTVKIDSHTYVATLGGPAKSVKDPVGESSRMRFELRGDALYQIFSSGKGNRTNVFTARDGGGIAMAVRMSSKQLPSDVRYRLSYAQAG